MKLLAALALLYLALILLAALTAPGTAPGDRRGSASPGSSPVPATAEAVPEAAGRAVVRRPAATRSRPLGPRLRWRALALCESSDNPRAVSPSGRFRGLYQFDRQTWRSVGGHGDPAGATRTEQTLRAQLLYGQRGRQPWPVCGVLL